ncbi:MAG: hypothetical protein J6D13_09530, partial [Clostridium sp.]|nr:hypothetical protein [Clostridium sp.]
AGYIALSGTARLAVLGSEALSKRFTRSFVKQCQEIDKIRGLKTVPGISASGAASWCRAGEGGVMAALWDYFEVFGLGFEIELRRLPILQETVEVCEVFDVNPYRLQSEGCILMTAANGGALAASLEKQGIPAVVIGRTTKSIGRRIYNGEIQTFLDRPKPDELYKIQLTGGKL